MRKPILIIAGIVVMGFCLFVGAMWYSLSTPTANERKQADFIRKISEPSYMTADFSDIDNGCDFKCSNPEEVVYSYASSTSYQKAAQDFTMALKSIGYEQNQKRIDTEFGLSDYEFTHTDTENNCTQLHIRQYHDLHHLDVSCYLEKININLR